MSTDTSLLISEEFWVAAPGFQAREHRMEVALILAQRILDLIRNQPSSHEINAAALEIAQKLLLVQGQWEERVIWYDREALLVEGGEPNQNPDTPYTATVDRQGP